MPEFSEIVSLLDTSIALALMVWLYSGLRQRHWKKVDEADADQRKLIADLMTAREQIARNGHTPDTQPIDVITRQDATD